MSAWQRIADAHSSGLPIPNGRDALRRMHAERRAGPHHGPVISGDPEMDPIARPGHGCGDPHQRLSALCSPQFIWGAETDKGTRRPAAKPDGGALAALWCG